VLFDLTYGVIGGFALCLLINLQNLARPAKIVKEEADKNACSLTVEGRVYFLSAVKLISKIEALAEKYDTVTVDFASVPRIDVTSAERLAKADRALNRKGKNLVLKNTEGAIEKRYHRFVKEIFH